MKPWDVLAPSRARDIDAGVDISYSHVLIPTVTELLNRWRGKRGDLLDIGCGVGRLTDAVLNGPSKVTAIDPSEVSAQIARKYLPPHVDVLTQTIQQYAQSRPHSRHDICLAIMVMQDVVDLRAFLRNVRKVMRQRGILVGAITHPYFWADYWGYSAAKWFDYNKELLIASQFRVSMQEYSVETLHVHRPLDWYTHELNRAKFRILRTPEPMLPRRTQRETGVSWRYPHFLFFVAEAGGHGE